MSDYLHNLVARHLNQIEVVQPRLASRFEPKSAMSPLPGTHSRPFVPEELESHLEIEPRAAESRIVSHRNDKPASLSPPVASEHRVVLEASTEDTLSPEPTEIAAPVSRVNSKPKADSERRADEHAQVVEEDRAPHFNEPLSLTETQTAVPVSPVQTQPHAQPSTPEAAAQAQPAQTIRAETGTPEKKSAAPPEPVSLQQTTERSDTAVTDTQKGETESSPAPLRHEIEITVERRETVRQPDAQSLNPATASQPVHHPEKQQPAALAKPEATEPTVRDSAPSHREVESAAQNISPAVREKVYERTVERVLVERLLPADARRSIRLPEVDSETAKPAPRPQRSAGVVAQPQVIRHAEPKAAPAADVRQGAEPAPTINVTIGRIEVRAVSPVTAASERRQSASQQRMSLSDYLRRRAVGGVK